MNNNEVLVYIPEKLFNENKEEITESIMENASLADDYDNVDEIKQHINR